MLLFFMKANHKRIENQTVGRVSAFVKYEVIKYNVFKKNNNNNDFKGARCLGPVESVFEKRF